MFIGFVNFYSDMWPSHAHILNHWPIVLVWKTCSNTLDRWKAACIWQNVCAYGCQCSHCLSRPKQFDTYNGTCNFQLGACIVQEGMPVAYFSQKLPKSQQNYTVMKKAMLFIVATLEEFWCMLLGADLHVFTYHTKLDIWHIKNAMCLALAQ